MLQQVSYDKILLARAKIPFLKIRDVIIPDCAIWERGSVKTELAGPSLKLGRRRGCVGGGNRWETDSAEAARVLIWKNSVCFNIQHVLCFTVSPVLSQISRITLGTHEQMR